MISGAKLIEWLAVAAYPYWARHGVDPVAGFYERLTTMNTPVDEPRRARLVARQIYCFSVAPLFGWTGPSRELAEHGLDFLRRYHIRQDGTIIASVTPEGAVVDGAYDPYDNAFVLFALAHWVRRTGDADATALAVLVRDALVRSYAHPECGFFQDESRSKALQANPHMHLLEAFLEWQEIAGVTDPEWKRLADAIAFLAMDRFVDPKTGYLPEVYDHQWRRSADARGWVIEPGHQFEWSWLLLRWSALEGNERAHEIARRMILQAEAHGVDHSRGVAFNEINERLEVRDSRAKLWPQSERIKAWCALLSSEQLPAAERPSAELSLMRAIAGLQLYLDRSPPGTWYEVMKVDGAFVDEPVKASSFYHIVCAIQTLATSRIQANSETDFVSA